MCLTRDTIIISSIVCRWYTTYLWEGGDERKDINSGKYICTEGGGGGRTKKELYPIEFFCSWSKSRKLTNCFLNAYQTFFPPPPPVYRRILMDRLRAKWGGMIENERDKERERERERNIERKGRFFCGRKSYTPEYAREHACYTRIAQAKTSKKRNTSISIKKSALRSSRSVTHRVVSMLRMYEYVCTPHLWEYRLKDNFILSYILVFLIGPSIKITISHTSNVVFWNSLRMFFVVTYVCIGD